MIVRVIATIIVIPYTRWYKSNGRETSARQNEDKTVAGLEDRFCPNDNPSGGATLLSAENPDFTEVVSSCFLSWPHPTGPHRRCTAKRKRYFFVGRTPTQITLRPVPQLPDPSPPLRPPREHESADETLIFSRTNSPVSVSSALGHGASWCAFAKVPIERGFDGHESREEKSRGNAALINSIP